MYPLDNETKVSSRPTLPPTMLLWASIHVRSGALCRESRRTIYNVPRRPYCITLKSRLCFELDAKTSIIALHTPYHVIDVPTQRSPHFSPVISGTLFREDHSDRKELRTRPEKIQLVSVCAKVSRCLANG